MAHDVFISHSAQDKAVADAVCHGLEQAGVRCWIAPRDIAPGLSWAAAIQRAVKTSKVLVLVFSGAADRSEHVRREVSAALDAGATILPFRLEHVQAGDELDYYLSGLHWLDATTPPLDAHVARLAQTVKPMLDGETGAAVGGPPPLQARSKAAAAPAPIAPPAPSRPGGNGPLIGIGLGLCGLVVVALLAAVAMSGNDRRSSPPAPAAAGALDTTADAAAEAAADSPVARSGDAMAPTSSPLQSYLECRTSPLLAPPSSIETDSASNSYGGARSNDREFRVPASTTALGFPVVRAGYGPNVNGDVSAGYYVMSRLAANYSDVAQTFHSRMDLIETIPHATSRPEESFESYRFRASNGDPVVVTLLRDREGWVQILCRSDLTAQGFPPMRAPLRAAGGATSGARAPH